MNTRVAAKRISKNERLVKRANMINELTRLVNGATLGVVLVLAWQGSLALLGWDKSPDSLLKLIKGFADSLAEPVLSWGQKYFPLVPSGAATYGVALLVYILLNILVRQLLKLFVRVPGAR
ncbi:hypothetical protein [Candidatus Cyanaurora vandensis]|uniref:hypothetical protein n=1 Tax=Candidatus Cyanaurora vandensis TaxID=2714958 RepID=UPI00257D3C08|nr:hypothetical protein [Candidatus Cyanaurora vandensis]